VTAGGQHNRCWSRGHAHQRKPERNYKEGNEEKAGSPWLPHEQVHS